MPQLVEDVGGELAAGYLFKLIQRHGTGSGEYHLAGRPVQWALSAGGMTISHPAPAVGNGSLSYLVRSVATVLPSGGRRHWWACPGCERRCDSLYLPAGRERLGCRRCCGLTYRSQQVTGPVAVRKERPGLWSERSYERWEFDRQTLKMCLVARRAVRRRL